MSARNPDSPVVAQIADGAAAMSTHQWRQFGIITVVAILLFTVLRWLPTGTNLSHMDFRVDAKNSIEFCDPLNPQFIPVVAVASPIQMSISAPAAAAGMPVRATVVLQTASGKPIAPADLLVVHTKRLHLLVIDPSLRDYQHVHPEPVGSSGEWAFEFTPKLAGAYRVFADFTPVATNRGLYANTELQVSGTPASAPQKSALAEERVVQDGYEFHLTAGSAIKAGQPADLTFAIGNASGGSVPLQPVMGAYAHLVAFDDERSGFAHLHPTQADPSIAPDPNKPSLNFKITIPSPGRYVIWAQVNLDGRETFVPFWFNVAG